MQNTEANNNHRSASSGADPSDVTIESLSASLYPDGLRLFVEIEVTPFTERPNLLILLQDAPGRILNELSVIATMHNKMEFTLHLRNMAGSQAPYTLVVELYYETRQPPQDRREISLDLTQQ